MPKSFKVSKITIKVFGMFKFSKMNTKFLTCSELVKWLPIFRLVQSSGLKQNYNYSASDFSSNSISDSNSDCDSDSSSAYLNLVIFVFFILYLHSSK